MPWLTSFLYSQLFVKLPVPSKDYSNQTIIVTGSNAGLGLEAARHVSRLNASLLILAVRNSAKGEAARRNILASTNRPESSIEVWSLDMQSVDSIEAFANRVNNLRRVDGIIENAGISTEHFKLVGGYESTIMTNVVGTFLLALLILPKLKETASRFNVQPKLSIVASDVHFLAVFKEQHEPDIFDALNNPAFGANMERYNVSKLLEVFAVRELAGTQALRSRDVIVNCMTPGLCQSELVRPDSVMVRAGMWFMKMMLARTTEVGGRALVAGLDGGEETHGQYMADCKVAPVSPFVSSEAGHQVQKRVWAELLTRLDKIHPGVSDNLK